MGQQNARSWDCNDIGSEKWSSPPYWFLWLSHRDNIYNIGWISFFSAFTSIFYPIGIVTFGLILIMLALINEGVFYIVENTEDILSESRKTNSLLKK